MENKKGLLFVVSAPSGAGKTTLCKEITKIIPDLKHSISYTTRKPRPGEIHGKDYFFVEESAFRELVAKNEFLEWAEVHNNLYGTNREFVTEITKSGKDLILDIDSQGAMQLKKKNPDAVFIYILPPSFDVLKSRLTERRADFPDEIKRRLRKAREEIWNYREYYYFIINDDVNKALRELESIIVAERIKMRRINLSWIEDNFIKSKEVI